MAEYPREPRNYELMTILLPELVDDELSGTIDRVSGYIGDVGATIREILQDSPWGRRRLAYTIRFNGTDYRDGYYVIWHFSSIPSELGDLERELKLDTRVIRYLLVIEDPKWGSPQEREAARELAAASDAEVAADEAVEDAEVVEAEAVAAAEAEEIVAEAEEATEGGVTVAEAEAVAEAEEAVAGAEAVVEAEEIVAEAAADEEVAVAVEVEAEVAEATEGESEAVETADTDTTTEPESGEEK